MRLEMIHIRVDGAMLEIFTDSLEVMSWLKEKIEQRVDSHKCRDDSIKQGFVRYDYRNKDAAIDAASNIVRQLHEDGWKYQEYKAQYVDGHWYQKLM